jgi:hypothetical protein
VRRVTRYSWTIHLGILALAVYVGADVARIVGAVHGELGSQSGGAVLPAPRPLPERPSDAFGSYAVIQTRHLFAGRGNPAQEEERPDHLPRSEPAAVQIRLAGTIVGGEASTHAILERWPGKTQELYRLGDLVQGMTVVEIVRDRVVLAAGDRRKELLSFQTSEGAAPAIEEAAPAVPQDGPDPRRAEAARNAPPEETPRAGEEGEEEGRDAEEAMGERR